MIVVGIHKLQSLGCDKPYGLCLAYLIFFFGEDVGIIIEDGGPDVVLKHAFDDGSGAGCATGVEQHLIILIDGFIMTACAVAAIKLYPAAQEYMIFTHCGDESGHKKMLDIVEAKPLLHLGLRLGEGTGALCAFPIVDSAVRMMNEMNNFANAKITKYF